MKGKVQSVLGPISPDCLGFTLPHEHISCNIENVFYTPSISRHEMEKSKISLQTVGWIRQYPYSSKENMMFSGAEVDSAAISSLARFKSLGGGTIVENSVRGLFNMNFEFMKKLSREIGIHIIAGTGFYVDKSHNEETLSFSEEQMGEIMIKEIEQGALNCPDVKCGIIGEIGCSWPLTDFERRSIRSSAIVEAQTGVPVMIHPGRDRSAPEEIIRIFSEAGGNPQRVVMAHLDRTFLDPQDVIEFADLGTYLEYDLFGTEISLYQMEPKIDMPSDAQRIVMIKHLISNDLVDRITLSHDVHTRHRLEEFGGHGYSHLIETVIPMMKNRGITEEQIKKMTVTNPAKWLTFVK